MHIFYDNIETLIKGQMKTLTLLFLLPLAAFSQKTYYTLELAELKPDLEIKIPFQKKAAWMEVVVHRTGYDTLSEYDLVMILKKKTVVTPSPVITSEIIDDRNPLIKYSPAWTPYTGTVYQEGTAQYTVTTGATATLTFTGNRVEYHAEKRFNHGIAGVKIDGGAEQMVDLYNPRTTNVKELVFDSGTLTQGPHTIVIRMTGNKNTAASENNIVIDYFKVYKAQ